MTTAIGFSGKRAQPTPRRNTTQRVTGNGKPEEYAGYLKNKRCIIVGPAGYLEGKGLGEWIDSFDVVVRLNWDGYISPELQIDYGKRCDVLYKRLLKLGQVDFIDVEEFKQANMQWCIAVDSPMNTQHIRHMNNMVGNKINWFVESRVRQEVFRQVGSSPLVGTVALKHLLDHDIQSLMITGCDFYLTGYHNEYGGREYRESMQRKEGVISPTHNAGSQLRYWNRLAAEDERLSFDETLTEISKHTTFISDASLLQSTVAIIPARYESSRFPGKPLALINGKPMILHVCERVSRMGIKPYVATDDSRIEAVVKEAGFQVIMTNLALTGTDRVAEAAKRINAKTYINIQGDEPLVDIETIIALIEMKRKYPHEVVNAMTPLQSGEADDRNVVKAVVRGGKHLVYASRAAVPAGKDGNKAYWKQLGIYAFNKRELQIFASLGKRAELEEAEDVEILRFIEMGIPVRMVAVKSATQAVDLPEHIQIVERLMNGA